MEENNNQYDSVNFQPSPVSPSQEHPVSISLPFLKSFTGWATFKAVMDIIVGSLTCLGIITAVYGVPLIIAGVRLLNAIDELKMYAATNDLRRIEEAFINLNKYFKLNGIVTIIKIIISIMLIIAYIAFVAYFISNAGDFIPNIDGFDGYEYSF